MVAHLHQVSKASLHSLLSLGQVPCAARVVLLAPLGTTAEGKGKDEKPALLLDDSTSFEGLSSQSYPQILAAYMGVRPPSPHHADACDL
jgi:hypothetical protein